MQKSIAWNYSWYKPFLFECGDIYICRVAPGKEYVHFEWKTEEGAVYSIHYRKRGDEQFITVDGITNGEYTLSGLEDLTDYEFYVSCGDKKSIIRLARTGEAVGTVVNYLHPDDIVYDFSGRALCSPCVIRHPNGSLLASMDVFAPDRPQNLCLLFRSYDDGKTWHHLTDLFPCYWPAMFIHNGELYVLGVSTEYGDLLIGKSTDGGETFGAPTVILRGSCSNKDLGTHRTPQNIYFKDGRLYTSCEWGSWSRGFHAASVISCDATRDLLDASNWSITYPVKYDSSWEGVGDFPSTGCIEGTVVEAPNGKLYNVMRYDMTQSEEKFGKVLAYEINTNDPTAPLKFSHAINLNGNHSKFMIRRDELTGDYFSIINRLTDKNRCCDRRLVSLMRSKDLENWELVMDLFDYRDIALEKDVGFQYIFFFIENDTIYFQCRTALNGARNFHDANYSTFHKIKNFRDSSPILE